jgi:hypothetical protein
MTYINPYLIFNAMRNVIRIAVWPDFDKFTENSLFSFLSLFAHNGSSYLRFLIFLKIRTILKTVNNFKKRRDDMQCMKYVLMLLCFSIFYACPSELVERSRGVTIGDVQKLTVNNFFGEWSKFLDQVLKEQKEHISDENEKTYQAFIEQAKQLHIPEVTGNKKSLAEMKEQIKAVEKRMGDEKKVVQDWTQLSESFANVAQPISAEKEEQYKTLIQQAKDVGIEKTQLDAMEAKMKELKGKLGVASEQQSKIPAAVIAPATVPKAQQEVIEHMHEH